jgi:fatty-acyl-CoA synthase
VPATALIQFTSGSVSAPKGVAVSGEALGNHLAALIAWFELDGEADRIAYWLPLYHDMGFVLMFLAGLASRADQVMMQPRAFAVSPATWMAMLARERATVTAAPDFAYRLSAAAEVGQDLSRVRLSMCGGERVHWQTLLSIQAATESAGLKWGAFTPGYGLAEAVVAVAASPPGRGPVRGPDGHVSAGLPLPGVTVQAPAGNIPGPVRLRAGTLFSGYHTMEGFVPRSPGDWFDTGDDGFISGGELYVIGRRDEVLTMAGRNLFAEDIESVAYNACGSRIRGCAAFRNPAAERFCLVAEVNPRRSAAVAAEDAEAGPGRRAAESARDLAALIRSSVLRELGTRLAPVLMVRVGAIPRTTSGKVQRARCRSQYEAGALQARLLAELT